jgi:diguanylate cyclase (GGDEF)-like protein
MRRILLVDSDRENLELISRDLTEDGHTLQSSPTLDGALHRLRAWRPHLILLNLDIPELSSLETISKIRNASSDDYAAIIIISADMSVENMIHGLEAGADDYLTRPFRTQDLIARVRSMLHLKDLQDALKRANHRIEELTSTDDLTGAMNMRMLYRKGEEEIVRARRFRKPSSALLLNIDGFSTVNQTCGFALGSKVLQEVAIRIKQCLRSSDLVARVGADEFFIFLCETDLASAEFIAERLRDSIEATPFKNERQSAKLTACLGVGGLTPDLTQHKMGDLLHITTEALKSAKAGGPNRIEVYSFT